MEATALPPPIQLMQLITGRWITHMIAVAAELGLADRLVGGPKGVEALGQELGASAEGLERLLRGLSTVGVFTQTAPRTYANSALSEFLRQDSPQSLRDMARMVAMRGPVMGWLELEQAVRTEDSAFQKAHGTNAFDYFREHPEEGLIFHGAMTAFSRSTVPPLLEAYDFGRFREVVDVGGGHGLFLRSLLTKFPGPKAILFDLPEVLSTAPQDDAGGRLKAVGGSFFEGVPAGADAYLMKHILHDWSDGHCETILGHIRKGMDPRGRVLVAEMVLPSGPEPHFGKILDLEMLAVTDGGRERTEEAFAALFARAGLRLVKVHPTPSPVSLIEAEAV